MHSSLNETHPEIVKASPLNSITLAGDAHRRKESHNFIHLTGQGILLQRILVDYHPLIILLHITQSLLSCPTPACGRGAVRTAVTTDSQRGLVCMPKGRFGYCCDHVTSVICSYGAFGHAPVHGKTQNYYSPNTST